MPKPGSKVGDIELKVPRLHTRFFETQVIQRNPGRQSSDEETFIALHLAGVSVNRLVDITEALWDTRVSPNTVSELNQKIYAQIEQWRERPIAPILVAVGGREDGHRKILGPLAERRRRCG